MAKLLDAWHDAETGAWTIRPALEVVLVTFERLNFGLSPPMKESTDVFVPVESEHDIENTSEKDAYWAKDHYRNVAWDKLRELPNGGEIRRGFSSWMPSGEVRKAKVVDAGLYAAVTELAAALDAETPLGP